MFHLALAQAGPAIQPIHKRLPSTLPICFRMAAAWHITTA